MKFIIAFLFGLLLVVTSTLQVDATGGMRLTGVVTPVPPPPTICSVFTSFSSTDGCSAGPTQVISSTLNFSNGNLLTPGATGTALQNPGAYNAAVTGSQGFHVNNTSTVNWNVPGVDYPVGVVPCSGLSYCNGTSYCGKVASGGGTNFPCSANNPTLIDAVQYNWASDASAGFAQTGCGSPSISISAGTGTIGNISKNLIHCSMPNGANINVQGFDFTPFEGGLFGENCTAMQFFGNTTGFTGTVTFKNNRVSFGGDLSCQVIGSVPILFEVLALDAWNINISNNELDGNGLNCCSGIYPGSGSPYPNNFVWPNEAGVIWFRQDCTSPFTSTQCGSSGGSTLTVKYNYTHDLPGRLFYAFSLACAGFDFSYNVVHNPNTSAASVHGEIYLPILSSTTTCPGYVAGTSWGAWQSWKNFNNMIWQDANTQGNSTSYFQNNFAGGNYITQVSHIVSNNVMLTNPDGWWFPVANAGFCTGSCVVNAGNANYTYGDILNLTSLAPYCTVLPTIKVTKVSGASGAFGTTVTGDTGTVVDATGVSGGICGAAGSTRQIGLPVSTILNTSCNQCANGAASGVTVTTQSGGVTNFSGGTIANMISEGGNGVSTAVINFQSWNMNNNIADVSGALGLFFPVTVGATFCTAGGAAPPNVFPPIAGTAPFTGNGRMTQTGNKIINTNTTLGGSLNTTLTMPTNSGC